jgi:hypothetical protein
MLAGSGIACSSGSAASNESDESGATEEVGETTTVEEWQAVDYSPCAVDTLVGSFEVTLEEEYTTLQGRVESGVVPYRVPEVIAAGGTCAFYQPPSLFCDPPCGSGNTCDSDGECIPHPLATDAGTVIVDGLSAAVEMTAAAPVHYYLFTGTLDHPGFQPDARLTLHATGGDEVEAFTLFAHGVEPLEIAQEAFPLVYDEPVTVEWTAGQTAQTGIHVVLNIAQHGGTPGWIECEFPDTGALEIPVSLTNELLEAGFSGFPSIGLIRRSVDSVEIDFGCVQWMSQSDVYLPIEIDGLTSCSDDEDCTPPETCQPDLTCG